MDVIIAFGISAFAAWYCDIDFFILYTFMSIATSACKSWITYTNDKTAKR